MSERAIHPESRAGSTTWSRTRPTAMAFYGESVRVGVRRARPRRLLRGQAARARCGRRGQAPPGVAAGLEHVRVGGERRRDGAGRGRASWSSRSTCCRPVASPPSRIRPARSSGCGSRPSAMGCQLVNEASAYAMSALHTPEPDAAARFYRDAFGWEIERVRPGSEPVPPARLRRWRAGAARAARRGRGHGQGRGPGALERRLLGDGRRRDRGQGRRSSAAAWWWRRSTRSRRARPCWPTRPVRCSRSPPRPVRTEGASSVQRARITLTRAPANSE